MLFDTHAHIDQDCFAGDLDRVVANAATCGVEKVLAVGCDIASSTRCVDLARRFEGVTAAAGIQPNYVAKAGPNDWDAIVRLSDDAQVVALGETGLDRYWDDTPFDQQQDYFDRHLRHSQATGLPFIVHMRDCEADIMSMLRDARERGPLCGVMHSFTGGAEMAAECVELGLHVSFAGMVTFKKSDDLRAVAATIPLDRLLVETDSPYLSPEPVRKIRRNEPAHVRHTAELLAKLRGESLVDFARQTTENASRLFQRQDANAQTTT